MNVWIANTKEALGAAAAAVIAEKLNAAIAARGCARIILSTGMSQFETLEALIRCDVPWEKVTMFHLDEYVNLPVTHIASFRKYLTERFITRVPLKEAVLVNGEGDLAANIAYLTKRLREQPIDVGVIGIGENAHIAFNDPPADFERTDAYHVVKLDTTCRNQQVREGWFAGIDDVPREAISMTPYQIMQCACIVSPVPRIVKADAVAKTLRATNVDPMVPASLLKTHADFQLYIDADSASGCDQTLLDGVGAQRV